jgi:hypothetical protein
VIDSCCDHRPDIGMLGNIRSDEQALATQYFDLANHRLAPLDAARANRDLGTVAREPECGSST